MALILHLETASPVCSVALSRDAAVLGFRESSEDKSHAARLTPMIRELLDEFHLSVDDLDAISLSIGPGSYTGLRIGTSVAKGLAYASGKPLIGLPTLTALAKGFLEGHLADIAQGGGSPAILCPMLDARRMEVYAAIYDTGMQMILPVEAVILEPLSFSEYLDKQVVCFFGTGSIKAAEIIGHPNARFFSGINLSAAFQSGPAESLYRRQEFLNTAYFEPLYLKEFIATIPKNRILG